MTVEEFAISKLIEDGTPKEDIQYIIQLVKLRDREALGKAMKSSINDYPKEFLGVLWLTLRSAAADVASEKAV